MRMTLWRPQLEATSMPALECRIAYWPLCSAESRAETQGQDWPVKPWYRCMPELRSAKRQRWVERHHYGYHPFERWARVSTTLNAQMCLIRVCWALLCPAPARDVRQVPSGDGQLALICDASYICTPVDFAQYLLCRGLNRLSSQIQKKTLIFKLPARTVLRKKIQSKRLP